MYLSVNQTNKKAIGLYKKMQYETISQRKFYALALETVQIKPPNSIKIIHLDPNNEIKLKFRKVYNNSEAKKLIESYYVEKDLAPQDMTEIIEMDCFDGLYIVESEDKSCVGGVCLSKIETDNVMGLVTFGVPVVNYTKAWFNGLMIGIWGLLSIAAYNSSNNYFTRNNFSYPTTFATLIFLTTSCLINTSYLKFTDIIQMFSGFKCRGRIFAPFYFGNPNAQKPIMEYLYEQIEYVARAKNMYNLAINFDPSDSMAKYYPKMRKTLFGGLFMAKSISENKMKINQVNEVDDTSFSSKKDLFFDPRDF